MEIRKLDGGVAIFMDEDELPRGESLSLSRLLFPKVSEKSGKKRLSASASEGGRRGVSRRR